MMLAQVWNGMAQGYGAIHPTCQACFKSVGERWRKGKTLALNLCEVIDADAKPHNQYIPNECFYCKKSEDSEGG